jgi:hypothetical protein
MWVPLLDPIYANESENPNELKSLLLPFPFLVHHAVLTILIEQLIAEIIPVLNISVSNAAIRPTLNGIVSFIFVEPAIRLLQDTHPECVKDERMMMESADIMTSTDTRTETSLENVKTPPVCLYLFIFQSFKKSNDLFFTSSPPFLSPSSIIKQIITMFLPPTSSFTPIVYPMSNKPYPPAILVKHSTWFLKNANLFICYGHELYGIHLSLFNQSPLFREIILYGKTNEIGINPYRPIPFDTLTKEVFDNFLYLIYYGAEHLEYLSPGEWLKVKRLCTDWCFP